MGFLSRFRGRGNTDDHKGELTPDEALTMFDQATAARFRALVRERLALMGREGVMHDDHVVTDDGNQYGFWNLAANCHAAERERDWPGLIDNHFRELFAAQEWEEDPETARANLHLRLIDAQQFATIPQGDDGPDFSHALEWAEGIVRVPVIDLPTTVLTPAAQQLRELGPMSELLDLAWSRTVALIATEDLTRERIEHDGSWFSLVMGESVFTASMAIDLPAVVRRFDPTADVSNGIVFALPFRHQIAYRVVTDQRSVMDALMLLPRFAIAGHSDSVGALSPLIFLWRDGELTALSRIDDDGIHVTPGPHLEEILRAGE